METPPPQKKSCEPGNSGFLGLTINHSNLMEIVKSPSPKKFPEKPST